MAAVNVMLAVQEKKTSAVNLYLPLRQYIATNYGERKAQAVEDDLDTVRQLRLNLEKPPDAAAAAELRRDCLLSYFRALVAMEPRLPISPDLAHVHSLTFTWFDAFKPSRKTAQQSIHLEKAAVLFNLGAVYSKIALSADRAKAAGLKQACNAFQSAAGAFAYLRDHAAARATSAGRSTVDISVECAGMLEKLMLAQGQECFFEKVIGDAKPPSLCSKVARQVGLYYEDAYAVLNAPPLNQHFDRTWISHVQLKAALFYAEACYRYSLDLHENEEIAEEISRLKVAINALGDAKKSSRGVAQPLLDAVNRLEAIMNHKLERAMKENNQVYLMRVPEARSLVALPAAPLVKSVSMAEVLDATKEMLFLRLVPDNSMKALSKYTDMVDNIIRTQVEKLQQGSEITRIKLREMDLPDSILALEGNFTLPLDLKEEVEAVQISGGPSGLEAELQQLKDMQRVNQDLLLQSEELLKKEANDDAQVRIQYGTKWNRPPSSTLTKNMQDKLSKFAAALKKATDSNARIGRSLRDNFNQMSVLEQKPIESALPSLARPIVSLNDNEAAIVGALKQSLRQLESLGAHRAGLEDMLKDLRRRDVILPKLMASTGSQEDLFKTEITKYDKICEEIAQNIEAQEGLLLKVQAQNEEFSSVFNLEDYQVAREKSYKQISSAIAKYRAIKENINGGLKFYATLQDATTNIKTQCSDFHMNRDIQLREMVEDIHEQQCRLSEQSNVQRNAYQEPNPQSVPTPGYYLYLPGEQPTPGYYYSYPSYATPLQAPYRQPLDDEWFTPSYYNAPQPQSGSHHQSSYNVQSHYRPPNQGSSYGPQ